MGRSWLRQQRAEAKLDESWARPKGMHETTAQRLRSIIIGCEMQREDDLAVFLARHERWLWPIEVPVAFRLPTGRSYAAFGC